jgi:excinuclease UvrABC ATPase subunit
VRGGVCGERSARAKGGRCEESMGPGSADEEMQADPDATQSGRRERPVNRVA